jgi:dolichol-phosphate mannosyltransferase
VLAVVAAVVAQIAGATVPGWTSVFVAVFFLAAVQLLCLGLLGEYIGRLYAEAQHRPLYLVATDTNEASEVRQSRPG